MGSKAKKVFLYKLGWLTPNIWTFTTSTPAALSFHSPRPQLTYSVAYGGLCVRARLTLCAISYTYLCETKAHGVPEKWVWSISSSIRSSCCSLSNWLLLFIDCAVDSATLFLSFRWFADTSDTLVLSEREWQQEVWECVVDHGPRCWKYIYIYICHRKRCYKVFSRTCTS